MQSRMLRWLIVISACAALPGMAHAQEATLSGTVTDTTGGVLPGVTITAVHEASGNTFNAVTDERGTYRMPLRTGVYRITMELPGFATVNRAGLELLVGQQVEVNLQMAPSALQESVTVTGETPLVDTTNSSLGGNIDPRQLQELPVNGRNWLDLTMLAPGSRANAVTETPTTRNVNNSGEFQLNVDGQQVTQTLAFDYGQVRFSRDAIAEFQFISNRFDATQGRSAGLQVNAITKSGTNTPSGSVSGYFRNDRFNAADFVQHRVLPYQDTQLSTTFGGPIRRDRIHFFAHYEYEREPQTFTYSSRFASFNVDQLSERREHKGGLKIDAQFSPAIRLAVRGNKYTNVMPHNPAFAGGATRHPTSSEAVDRWGDGVFGVFTQVLSSRAVNEIKGGYSRFSWFRRGVITAGPAIETPKGPGRGVPVILLQGYRIGQGNGNIPAVFEPQLYSVRDDFTYSFTKGGRHDVKIGGEYIYAPVPTMIALNGFGTLDAQGGPIPANIETLFPVWNDVTTWNLAPLSSISRRYTLGVGDFTTETPRDVSAAWFQDDWAMTSNLTLNLGLRYDVQAGALAEGTDFPPFLSDEPHMDLNNLAPRLGFAYTLNDRTVVRGGFGQYFAEVSDNLAAFVTARLVQANVEVLNDGRADFASNPFNGPTPTFQHVIASGARRDLAGLPGPTLQIPYSWQGSVGVQRQLRDTIAVDVDYVYAGGRHERMSQNLNLSYNPATGANYPFTDLSRRPYPQYGTVDFTFMEARSNSHALQTAFRKRLSQRWQASATYTLAALWDSKPGPLGLTGKPAVAFPLATDIGEEYTLAAGDQRHRAVFNGIWDAGLGFQVSGLYFFGSGERFSTSYGGDLRNGAGGGRLRPDGTIVPRNTFVGTPIHRVDLRLQRGFRLGGRARIDGILEVFNVFNHENFGAYTTQESNRAYGRPSSHVALAYAARMAQLGFRLTF